MSFNRRARRLPSDQSWKRISRHFSHLSTNISFDEASESEDSAGWPLITHRSDPSSSPSPGQIPKILKVRFKVSAATKYGYSVGVVGNLQELGMWNIDRRLVLVAKQGEYPLWTSEELDFTVRTRSFSAEYKYVMIESSGVAVLEKRVTNRRLEVKFAFCDRVSLTISDKFEMPAHHIVDVRHELPLFGILKDEGSLYDHLQTICTYFEERGAYASLQDFLCLSFLCQHWLDSGLETESKQCLDLMLRLTETLLTHSTEEIEPVIREVLSGMARCSIPFWRLTRSIVDRGLVETERVPLGCHSAELFDFVSAFLNISQSPEEGATRSVSLNSIRRSLRRLRERSSTPDLLMLYDICLEEIELAYISSHYSRPGSENLLTNIHRVTIILECLELSSICARDCSTYQTALDAVWHASETPPSSLESIKGVLLDVLRTFVVWTNKYSNTEALSPEEDLVGLRDILREIAAKYSKVLFPALADALHMVDIALCTPIYLPFRTGTAVGKVVAVMSLSEIPIGYSSLIVILLQLPDKFQSLPETVKAVVVLADVPFDSRLLAYCNEKSIALAITQKENLPAQVISCVEVRIFEDSLEFV